MSPFRAPSKAIEEYLELRALTDQGRLEAVSRKLRDQRGVVADPTARLLRALISTRIAIRTSPQSVDSGIVSPEAASDTWTRAEIHSVRGLHLLHLGDHESGRREYLLASDLFARSDDPERSVLTAFNAWIAATNLNEFSDIDETIDAIRPVEKRAFEGGFRGTLGLILREKASFLQKASRPNAALADAKQACRLLELYGARADHHLALLIAAESAIDLGRTAEAHAFVERIIGIVEERVRFPLEVVRARLGGPIPDPANFEVVSQAWRKKWEKLAQSGAASTGLIAANPVNAPSVHWDSNGQSLHWRGNVHPIKEKSLEGRVLKALSARTYSKQALCEMLWPEHCETSHLDNRLHRLVSRINAKLGKAISFDGKTYRLS